VLVDLVILFIGEQDEAQLVGDCPWFRERGLDLCARRRRRRLRPGAADHRKQQHRNNHAQNGHKISPFPGPGNFRTLLSKPRKISPPTFLWRASRHPRPGKTAKIFSNPWKLSPAGSETRPAKMANLRCSMLDVRRSMFGYFASSQTTRKPTLNTGCHAG
jgi:hypothetical protein